MAIRKIIYVMLFFWLLVYIIVIWFIYPIKLGENKPTFRKKSEISVFSSDFLDRKHFVLRAVSWHRLSSFGYCRRIFIALICSTIHSWCCCCRSSSPSFNGKRRTSSKCSVQTSVRPYGNYDDYFRQTTKTQRKIFLTCRGNKRKILIWSKFS